jgi:hypothetical protein
MKINKLPGNKGSYIAQTAKKTRTYRYQVNGTAEEIQLYMQAKEQEGYPAIVDQEFGVLYLTAINQGREANLEVYPNQDGILKVSAYNTQLQAVEEMRAAGVSNETIDKMIIEALNKGAYAKPVTVTSESNVGAM